MRKTKIVCTIGPASDSEEMLRKLCLAGMNVARLNFSHGTHDEHLRRIEKIRKVRSELNLPIAIMLDTKGPEYRIGTFKDGSVELKEGDPFIFTPEEVEGTEERVSVSYPKLYEDMAPGDTILLNNGLMVFRVTSIQDHDIHTVVECGGVLSNRKSMSFPGKVPTFSLVSRMMWISLPVPSSPSVRIWWMYTSSWIETAARELS